MRGQGGFIGSITGSRTLRTVFNFLFLLNTVILICFSMAFSFLYSNSFYTSDGEHLQEQVTDRLMVETGHKALIYFDYYLMGFSSGANRQDDTEKAEDKDVLAMYAQVFKEENSNFFYYFRLDGKTIFNNYRSESGRSYYPKASSFFGADVNLQDKLTFEGHLKKTLTAHDAFWRASRFFEYANAVKYAVPVLLALFAALESGLIFVLYSAAGRGARAQERDLDRIPLYILVPFLAVCGVLSIMLLQRQRAVLTDLVQVFSDTNVQPTVYIFLLLLIVLAVLLQMLVTTIGVRMHRPLWWRRSILYHAFAARGFGQRARTVLTVTAAAQFALYLVVFMVLKEIPEWVIVAADGAFTLTMALLLYVVWKDMSVYIPQTHRIAQERRGYMPTEGLSDSGRRHAENINFLSRSANAETEKRFVNESFSAKLIHSVSHGLREPLRDVAQNVHMLEDASLTDAQAHQCIERILTLSQELKKTIENMILISKATTGNLPFDPVSTDAGMMLSQAVGEFDAHFAQKGIEPVIEHPPEPVLIRADGQFMWYVFEGILSVMLENAAAGTRLFLRAARTGEKAVIVFRCTVRAEAMQQIHELSGMGLSSAKVFTMLQDGTMVDRLSHDTLTAVVQLPAVTLSGNTA